MSHSADDIKRKLLHSVIKGAVWRRSCVPPSELSTCNLLAQAVGRGTDSSPGGETQLAPLPTATWLIRFLPWCCCNRP